jgi:hypothetical protein
MSTAAKIGAVLFVVACIAALWLGAWLAEQVVS